MRYAATVYACLVIVMSCVAFVSYGLDKWRAVHGGRRVPEQTLHLLAFLGGWPGAMLGQRHFCHKTRKTSYLIVFWLVVVAHVAMVGAVAYAVLVLGRSEAIDVR